MELRHVAMFSSVLLCFSAAPAFARTLVVDNDGGECPQAEYNTIQQAVAVAEAGDKILVCPSGRYPYLGTVLVTESNLRIEAQGAPGEVVLQGTGAVGELGFVLLNTTGVVLQGFTVQGFGRAQIRIQGGGGNTVRKNVTKGAVVNDGIQVTSSSGNLVEQNTSHDNRQDGIFVGRITDIPFEPASDNIIRHNETFNNRFGIHLSETGTGNVVPGNVVIPGNVVFGNRAHANTLRGIQNNLSNKNVIEYNHVFANGPGAAGIFVLSSTGVTIRNNKVESNGSNGITLNTAGNNVVTNNQSDGNGAAGVNLNGSSGNVVEKNELSRNGQDGIRLFNNAATNIVQSNHIRRSGRDGIRAEVTSHDNTIERNHIKESAEHDAHDDTLGIGTGGTANFWIDNHCQTENRLTLCDR
jgi:parallel beta-helix repeat protein